MWQCHEGGIFAKVEKMVGRGGEQTRDTKTNKMTSALKYRCQIEAVVTRTRHNETNFNDEMSDRKEKRADKNGRMKSERWRGPWNAYDVMKWGSFTVEGTRMGG